MPLKEKPVLRTNPNVSGRVADAQKRMVQETMSYAGAGLMQSRGPKTLTHVMDALMARNGYGRMMAASDLEKAWDKLLGRPKAEMTKIGAVKRGVLNVFLAITFLLGFVFVGLQAEEYHHAYTELGLQLSTGVYGSTFFMLTGFHGFHVCLGALMLLVVWFRTMKGHFTPERHFAFEAVAWYWHFVDVVWLGLFIFVYWL